MNFKIKRKDIEAIKKIACYTWYDILDRIVEEFDSPRGLVIPPAVVKDMFNDSGDVQKSVLEGVFPKFGDQKFAYLLGRYYPVGIMPDGKEWIESNVNYPLMGWHHANNDYVKRLKYGTFHTFDMCESINRKLENGWRIATQTDFKDLLRFEARSGQFLLPSEGGTDEFGLGIVFGGWCDNNGIIQGQGVKANYWDITENYSTNAQQTLFDRYLVYYSSNIHRHFGYSARCVRDVK